MLQVRCPNCDAPIATQAADARGMVECARCGRLFDAESRSKAATEQAAQDEPPGLTVHVPSLPGKHVFRLVQSLAKRPSFFLRTKASRKASNDQPIHAARQAPRLRLFGWVPPELRRIFFAALAFLGIPAAVIFFVLVVCAPKDDAVLRRPVRAERPQAAKTVRHSWLPRIGP